MKETTKNRVNSRHFKIAAVLVVLALCGLALWAFSPVLGMLGKPDASELIREYIDGFGPAGVCVFLAIQILQIVVAFIPGEPIEVLAGMMYGTVPGLLMCMLGCFVGSILVFFLVKWLGRDLVHSFFSEEKLHKLKFLNDKNSFEKLTFLLFFIPGTPKDILTYVAGLTPIRPLRFFIISSIARIPSIVTSTLAGSLLIKGQAGNSIIAFAVAGGLSLVGIFIYNQIVKRYNAKREKQS